MAGGVTQLAILGGVSDLDAAARQVVYNVVSRAQAAEGGLVILESPTSPVELLTIYHGTGLGLPITLYARSEVDLLRRSYVTAVKCPAGTEVWSLTTLAERVGQAVQHVTVLDDHKTPLLPALTALLRLYTVVEVMDYA